MIWSSRLPWLFSFSMIPISIPPKKASSFCLIVVTRHSAFFMKSAPFHLQAQCNPHCISKLGHNPLPVACAFGCCESIAALLDVPNIDINGALHLALVGEGAPVEVLLSLMSGRGDENLWWFSGTAKRIKLVTYFLVYLWTIMFF